MSVIKTSGDLMKVWGYIQCEFDIAAGVSAEDIKDIVFSKFYDIAISIK